MVGQLKIAKSGKDTVIANMISTKGYIGAALADAYLESIRSGESSQSEELFTPNTNRDELSNILLEGD